MRGFDFSAGKVAALLMAALMSASAQAQVYRFQFLANPDALEADQDTSLDVLHTVTLDASKIPAFNSEVLDQTSTWLNGGITMTMSNEGQTVTLNDALDPGSKHPTVKGAYYDEGFISLSARDSFWFYALEFAPDSPFIDSNGLSYDAFVYGFLFPYQNQKAYQDFRQLWTDGDTSVLPAYRADPISTAVPEPASAGMMLLGLAGGAAMWRRGAHSARSGNKA